MSIALMLSTGSILKRRNYFYLLPPDPFKSNSYNHLYDRIDKQLQYRYNNYKNCSLEGLLECGENFEGFKIVVANDVPPNDKIIFPVIVNTLLESTVNCNNSDFIISIMSSPNSFIERHAYRKSYQLLPQHYPLFFFMGYSDDETINTFISQENEKYNDIIQFNIKGSYYKLSAIMIGIIRWLKSHCFHYTYIIHHQTDIFFNFPYFLIHIYNSTITNVCPLIGLIRYGYGPVRDPKSIFRKWYVPESIYPYSIYPNFPSAACILFSESLIYALNDATYHVETILHMDDVFIGLLLNYTGYVNSQCNYEGQIISNYPSYSINSLNQIKENMLWIHALTPGSIYFLSKNVY